MSALDDIAAERRRQIEVEGWTPEHDDEHADFELSRAATCYALTPWRRTEPDLWAKGERPFGWPWSLEWWKPKTPRQDLVRAAALIVAEIERLDRASNQPSKGDGKPL